ncbi:vacuolar sorting protein SNF7 family protein, putative [Talaromyces stipitatus ATCC 10500]|uniref:Vacuolar sorting protein SNF7 family protein, putative n=1 Tax=Talaromyces stipitatus (strain ATCC 10500 / CBS 375.48 / QM 6759 / NRRL 1006) TaxID=441959 RepID=B8MR10_TALSN|nr:vacuolar sorting protein SNF7 family protein, putative [Talaromyces stipitatus ATCC 10500]EED12845.1 vacuolar sorting protein SNF7 family protein, putative [Talaromyces stipitatus ATCC 10500]
MSDLLNYILSHEDAFRKNRLPSLYSDFAIHKSTNPDGYAVNVAAWEKALTNAARAGHVSFDNAPSKKRDHLILVADENLLHMLEIPECGTPVALASVFDEAIQKRIMVPFEVYRSSNFKLSTSRWRILDSGVLSPWNVMNWSLRQLKGFVVGSDNTSGKLHTRKLVLVENLKETAKRVLHLQSNRKSSSLDRIYSKERFTNTFSTVLEGDTVLSDDDIEALLIYLSRDINAIFYDGKTIKFLTGNDRSPVTPEDTTIASMKDLISNLTEQISRIELKIGELNINAKNALANKNRISALSAIKNKKIAEHNLNQRANTLHQLEEVYNKIEQSTDQIEIVRVMQASTGVLRSLHAQIGGVERVEDVIENLREEMSKVDEVGNIINEAGPVIDESEIDDELEALETKELREKEEEAKVTRQRLEQLESHEQAARQAAREASKTAEAVGDVESELAASIGQLSNMSLKDSAMTEREGQHEVEKPVPAQ